MCGRFTLRTNASILSRIFGVQWNAEVVKRWNIAPTQLIWAVRRNALVEREAVQFRWGLIPAWARDVKIASSTINARAETVAEKPAFAKSFRRQRCLIPVDGFYEWKRVDKTKIPFLIQLKDSSPFAFAGIWDRWNDPMGRVVESCSIITTTPNELMSTIHDRMPVILKPSHFEDWLFTNELESSALKSLLIPYPAVEMCLKEVSTVINKPGNETDPTIYENSE